MMRGRGIVYTPMVVMVVVVVVAHRTPHLNEHFTREFNLNSLLQRTHLKVDCGGNGVFAVGLDCYKLMEERTNWRKIPKHCQENAMVAAYPKPNIREEVFKYIRERLKWNGAFYVGVPDFYKYYKVCHGYDRGNSTFTTLDCKKKLRYVCQLRRKH